MLDCQLTYDSRTIRSRTSHGLPQRGVLVFYNDNGDGDGDDDDEITPEQATDLFWGNEPVIVPAAGAGSYRPILMDFGCEDIKVLDWTTARSGSASSGSTPSTTSNAPSDET